MIIAWVKQWLFGKAATGEKANARGIWYTSYPSVDEMEIGYNEWMQIIHHK